MTMRSPSPQSSSKPTFPLALDRAAIALIVLISLAIAVLMWGGERIAPKVRDFTWQGRQVGADDMAFLLTFSRPMDHESVENNLRLEPPLPGKTSWAGRRMAYTLNTPAPYGTKFQVKLQGARERFGTTGIGKMDMQPYVGQFQSRDRAFAYIGVEGDEAGRLLLFNLTQNQKLALTPPNLVVMDFKPYPLGDRILFAATERSAEAAGLVEQKLYSVTTGVRVNPPEQLDAQGASGADLPATEPVGKVQLVLDNQDYQNLRFDLAANGKIIVVQRVNRKNPADFGPWLVKPGEAPKPLKGEPGGDFLITPDSNSLAIAQGQGLAILPLEPGAKPLDFLPKFGVVKAFSRDGSLATMIKFNTDRTRSLFLVSNQGTQTELFRLSGSILSTEFDTTKKFLYCVLTELVTQNDLYQENPYLAVVDLKTKQTTILLALPQQRDVQAELSPDGFAILFDQVTEARKEGTTGEILRDSSGQPVVSRKLWLLPLDPTKPTAKVQAEPLPLDGIRPHWLP
jgi:hypothetical protein